MKFRRPDSHPSPFFKRKRRRCDSNTQGRFTPGGLARRCTTFCAAPPRRKVRESNPQERLAPTVFGTARRARAQPSKRWQGRPDSNREERVWSPPVCLLAYAPPLSASGGNRTPTPLKGHSFTGCCRAVSASDARSLSLQDARWKIRTKAGGQTRLRPLKIFRLSNSKRKSGPSGFPTGSRPAPYASLRTY